MHALNEPKLAGDPALMAAQLEQLVNELSTLEVPTTALQPSLWQHVKRKLSFAPDSGEVASASASGSAQGPPKKRKRKQLCHTCDCELGKQGCPHGEGGGEGPDNDSQRRV